MTLTAVPGILVGHAGRVGDGWRTGVTVVRTPPGGAVAGVDVRGAAPGTRETDLLDPRNLVDRVHAIVLAGGSAYGLAAATGVMDRLADAGIGFPIGDAGVVPIVPAAVIFDLGRGGVFRATPDADLGAAAYDAASAADVAQGSVGAGTGAVAGGLAGGVGSWSTVLPDGTTVAALAVVNSAGSPVDPGTGRLYGDPGLPTPDPAEVTAWMPPPPAGLNTTIGVVATDATLTKAQCARLAGSAHDGMARAIRPVHTMVDGDTVFALATGGRPLDGINALLVAAADCFERAVAAGVYAASGRADAPAYRDVFPSATR